MSTDYRKQADMLIEDVSDLQKHILVKHTTALLEELHETLRSARQDALLADGFANDYRSERDQCIEVLRMIYTERGEDARICELCEDIFERFHVSS